MYLAEPDAGCHGVVETGPQLKTAVNVAAKADVAKLAQEFVALASALRNTADVACGRGAANTWLRSPTNRRWRKSAIKGPNAR